MTTEFVLDPRLRQDCHALGRLPFSHLLLVDKAEVPWFVLVPETVEVELCDLDARAQAMLLDETNRVARFVRAAFPITKLNVGALGNIVRQMHIHVLGRREDDPWWPGPAWGQSSAGGYRAEQVAEIGARLSRDLGADYRAA
ncbi:MAG: HIT domain-containing protein [Gammaproteobacteria bacterium]